MQREPAGQLAQPGRIRVWPASERVLAGSLHIRLVGQRGAGKSVRMLVVPKPQGHGHVECRTMLTYGRLKLFTYGELRKATGDFDSS